MEAAWQAPAHGLEARRSTMAEPPPRRATSTATLCLPALGRETDGVNISSSFKNKRKIKKNHRAHMLENREAVTAVSLARHPAST